jgi:hypothetical protein
MPCRRIIVSVDSCLTQGCSGEIDGLPLTVAEGVDVMTETDHDACRKGEK